MRTLTSWLVMANMVILVGVASGDTVWTVGSGGEYDFNSIQEAIDWSLPGETVMVYPGQYPENLTLNKTLNLIGVMDEAGNRPTINPSSGKSLMVYRAEEFEVANFIFDGAQGGIYHDKADGTRNILIHDNIFRNLDAKEGFSFGGDKAGGEGIYVGIAYSDGEVRVYNNLFYNNTGYSNSYNNFSHSCTARIRSDTGSHYFYNNTLVNNSNDRCSFYLNAPNIEVVNNIFMNEEEGYAMSMWGYSNWWNTQDIRYNIVYDCEKGIAEAPLPYGRIITQDPQFIDPDMNDFRLSPYSPAIDAGIEAFGLSDDFYDNPRPYDFMGMAPGGDLSNFDIGAHELILLPGDANLDGKVDIGDLGILASNYGMQEGATWMMGDFNGDERLMWVIWDVWLGATANP